MSLQPSDYFLSDADNAAIFEQQIGPIEFGNDNGTLITNTATPGRPVCIILAGQTGAGKSHAAPVLAASLSKIAAPRSRLCHLVADSHKPYHPAYAGLLAAAALGRAPAGLASAATGHDARRWLARACAVAAAQKRPTLVESASRYPQDVAAIATTFQAAGYRVCFMLLSVHTAQSRLGLLARFLDAGTVPPSSDPDSTCRHPSMPVRLTPRAIHDESCAGLALLAGMLDAQDGAVKGKRSNFLADAVLIVRRGNFVAYANDWQRSTGTWQTMPAGVCRALATEQSRRWTCNDSERSGNKDQSGAPLAREAVQFAYDVARLRAAHPDRVDELIALADEYGLGAETDDDNASIADKSVYRALDADTLVTHLQSSAW
ncbi:hypothetical protein SEPCBS119000_005743 [Sporothrix epigloea]|uniref:Zeta toxin domain-containing protein n=1 Tax=Sporothrix epigloea TaxID=1892477 RepID=A0ABP0E0C6_9PEZI